MREEKKEKEKVGRRKWEKKTEETTAKRGDERKGRYHMQLAVHCVRITTDCGSYKLLLYSDDTDRLSDTNIHTH